MRLFTCPSCRRRVYFENSICLNCQAQIGYDCDSGEMQASPAPPGLRPCAGGAPHCNWLVDTAEPESRCRSCRLTELAPDLGDALLTDLWSRLEQAKRRLLYTLASSGLSWDGLRFAFPAVGMTGHDEGLITIALGEADDVEREQRRIALGEPYRTMIGHLRHESGHFYWDRLVRGSTWLDEVRTVFGDDRADYQASLAKHYKDGPPATWPQTHVTAYATAHPWEDWAETWAHYLHMVDAIELSKAYGMRLDQFAPPNFNNQLSSAADTFTALLSDWLPLTTFANSLNRSIGLHDWYPFILADSSLAKLRLVHRVIHAGAAIGACGDQVEHVTNAGLSRIQPRQSRGRMPV